MNDRWAAPLLLFISALTIGSYVTSWRSKHPALKKSGIALIAPILAFGAFCTSFGALALSSDFFRPGVSKIATAVSEVIVVSAAIYLWMVFARILKAAENENAPEKPIA